MNEFLKRLNTAYENEYERIKNTDMAHDCDICEKFHNAMYTDISFRTLFYSLEDWRKHNGYDAVHWNDIPRYEIDTTTGENAVYLAIINFGK